MLRGQVSDLRELKDTRPRSPEDGRRDEKVLAMILAGGPGKEALSPYP